MHLYATHKFTKAGLVGIIQFVLKAVYLCL
jgi:hypothetical protein